MKKSPLLKQAKGQLRWRSNLSLQFSMPPTRLLKQVQQVRIASKTLGWKKNLKVKPFRIPTSRIAQRREGGKWVFVHTMMQNPKKKCNFGKKLDTEFKSIFLWMEQMKGSLIIFEIPYSSFLLELCTSAWFPCLLKQTLVFTLKKWLVTPIYFHSTNVCDKLCLVSQVEVFFTTRNQCK